MAYQPFQINNEVAKQAAAAAQSYGSNQKYRRFKVSSNGLHRVRILPPYSSEGLLGFKVWRIWGVPDPEKTGETTYHTCIELTYPEHRVSCPILEVMNRYRGSGLDKFFEKLKPQPVAFMNALVRSTTNTNVEKYPIDPTLPIIFETQQTTLDWVYSKCMDPDFGNITDPFTGRDVKITRVQKGEKISYDREVVPVQTPLFEDEQMIHNALANMYNLSEIYKYPDDRIYGRIMQSARLLEDKIKYLLSAAQSSVAHSAVPASYPSQQPPANPENWNTFPGQTATPPAPQYQQPVQQQPPAQPQYPPVAQPPAQTYAPPVQQQPVAPPVQFTQPAPSAPQAQPSAVEQMSAPQPAPLPQVAMPQQPPVQQMASVTQPSGVDATLAAKGIRKPDSSPACFADQTVFNPQRKECLICIYDTECGDAISKIRG